VNDAGQLAALPPQPAAGGNTDQPKPLVPLPALTQSATVVQT
jgi:hypothetical protein